MKKMTSLFADLWSHSKFRTQRKSQQKTDPKSEMTLFVILSYTKM